jgi:RimJ/RimL family protein N-acetyltransferase
MRAGVELPCPQDKESAEMILRPITHELAASPEMQASDFLKELCATTVAIYPQGPAPLPWVGYLAEEQGVLVGTCAFKAPPAAGTVEIAYFTFPAHEGRGVATRMAASLVEIAGENGATRIKAQTLPETNASTRILEKLGFRLVGPVMHPEDGEVWEWHR